MSSSNIKTQNIKQVSRCNIWLPPSLTVAAALLLSFVALLVATPSASAQTPGCDTLKKAGQASPPGYGLLAATVFAAPAAAPAAAPDSTVPAPCPNDCPKAACIIDDYLNPIVKALIATTGVIAVISLVIGAIQYENSGGDSSKVAAAKGRIGKTIGAFMFFLFLYAFLNYIVPGGV